MPSLSLCCCGHGRWWVPGMQFCMSQKYTTTAEESVNQRVGVYTSVFTSPRLKWPFNPCSAVAIKLSLEPAKLRFTCYFPGKWFWLIRRQCIHIIALIRSQYISIIALIRRQYISIIAKKVAHFLYSKQKPKLSDFVLVCVPGWEGFSLLCFRLLCGFIGNPIRCGKLISLQPMTHLAVEQLSKQTWTCWCFLKGSFFLVLLLVYTKCVVMVFCMSCCTAHFMWLASMLFSNTQSFFFSFFLCYALHLGSLFCPVNS